MKAEEETEEPRDDPVQSNAGQRHQGALWLRVSAAVLGVSLAFVLLLAWTKKTHSVAVSLTIAEQEVIEALLSQGELGLDKNHVLKETTSIKGIAGNNGYEEFSNELREQARDRRTIVDKLFNTIGSGIPPRYGDAFKEALEDFLQKNKTELPIVFPTNPPRNVSLVSAATLHEVFSAQPDPKPNGWALFYRRFPDAGGLTTISRAGIDSKGTVAIIYAGNQRGYLAGEGGIRILKKQGKKWVLHERERIGPRWVS